MLAALGAAPVDRAGARLPDGGVALSRCARLAGEPALEGLALVAAADVTHPLLGPHGAARVFGPQKGADPQQVAELEVALARWADVLAAATGRDVREEPGAGAAGGLGAALLALGASRQSGAAVVRTAVGLNAELDRAELVVTGEGSFDAPVVARQARHRGRRRGRRAGGAVPGARRPGAIGPARGGRRRRARGVGRRRARRLGGRRAGRSGRYPRRARRARRRAPRCVTMRGGNHRSREDVGPGRDPAEHDPGRAMTVENDTVSVPIHGVELTDAAAAKAKTLLDQEGRPDMQLRIAVQPGGCAGLRYQLFFDERTLDGDAVRTFKGLGVVVDRMSAPYLQGAVIDFVDTIEKQGFTIDNPNAGGSCACGDSFN